MLVELPSGITALPSVVAEDYSKSVGIAADAIRLERHDPRWDRWFSCIDDKELPPLTQLRAVLLDAGTVQGKSNAPNNNVFMNMFVVHWHL
jgi:hypothetical protein